MAKVTADAETLKNHMTANSNPDGVSKTGNDRPKFQVRFDIGVVFCVWLYPLLHYKYSTTVYSRGVVLFII